MKKLFTATIIGCLCCSCTYQAQNEPTIKLPPQDSAIDIDHTLPADSVLIKDSTRRDTIY